MLAAIAAYFLWIDDFDGGFVAGILCVVSFLISMRIQVKARLKAREELNSDES